MRKITYVVIVSVLLAVAAPGASAEPRHWYKDWKFVAGLGVIGASLALDGHSTCQGFDRGLVETSPLARGSTSCCDTAAGLAGGFSFYAALHFLDRRYVANGDSGKWDWLGNAAVPAIAGAIHLRAAAHNYSLNSLVLRR